jgi:hypothetical protein
VIQPNSDAERHRGYALLGRVVSVGKHTPHAGFAGRPYQKADLYWDAVLVSASQCDGQGDLQNKN